MQLLIHITSHEQSINPIMKEFMRKGFHGATSVECEGMLHAINEDSIDAPAIFGGLRKFVNPDHQHNKMLLILLRDEDVNLALDIIHSVSGDLKLPNTGIVFTLPVTRWEGVSAHQQTDPPAET